jgi:RHS repeat-associated protein
LQLRYRFDAQGRRTQRYKNNQLTHSWLYLDQLRIAAELKPNGDLLQQFAYGEKINVPSLIIRQESGVPVIYRVISDHLGSVRLVVKASDGTVVQRMRFDEFGRVLEDSNPGFQPFGYAGGLYDGDSGLVRFGARDYDPEIGRWLTKDPIRFEGGNLNLYSYLHADPINFIDPTGELDIASGEGVTQARKNIRRLIKKGGGKIKLGDMLPMLDDEVLKTFDEKRGMLDCKVNEDGSADFSNSGDPLEIDYDGGSVDFDKDMGARVLLGEDGEVIIDNIKGVDPSGINPGKLRITGNRVCTSVLFTASCP